MHGQREGYLRITHEDGGVADKGESHRPRDEIGVLFEVHNSREGDSKVGDGAPEVAGAEV